MHSGVNVVRGEELAGLEDRRDSPTDVELARCQSFRQGPDGSLFHRWLTEEQPAESPSQAHRGRRHLDQEVDEIGPGPRAFPTEQRFLAAIVLLARAVNAPSTTVQPVSALAASFTSVSV
jgi:hypothetical protein